MNAHSTPADAKVTDPAAVLTLTRKGKKAAGKAGLAEALLPQIRKGAGSFARLMSAKIGAEAGEKTVGKSLASLLTAAGAGLKGTARAALAAQGVKAAIHELPSGLIKILDENEKLAPGKDEKSDGRKKTARLIASHAVVTAEAGADKSRSVESTAASGKHADEPVAQASPGARAAPTPKIVPIHVVDLRKRTSDKSADGTGGAQKIAQASPAFREPGTPFMPQQSLLKDIEAPRKAASASAAAPQSGLERLREMAGSELIRASNLVLRDGGGEIRLVLKPDSLGSVRIRMNLVDNKIEGRIIVDTSAVKQVMDQSIDALSRALTAGGFQTDSLEVSVGGQNADNGRQMQEPPADVRRVAAEGFERNIPGEESLGMGDLLVDLFV